MNESNNKNDNDEPKDEYEAFEEPLRLNYSPDDMRNIWSFRINETLKGIKLPLQMIADELHKKHQE